MKSEDQGKLDRLLLLIVNELVEFRTTIADEVIKIILRSHKSQEFVSPVLSDHRDGLNEETIQNLVTVLLANTFTTVVKNSFYNSLKKRGVKHG